jgi:hypothetical protein
MEDMVGSVLKSDPSLMVEVGKYLADTNKINAKGASDNQIQKFVWIGESAGARICMSLVTVSQSVKGLTNVFPVTRLLQHSLTHSQITISNGKGNQLIPF